MKKNLLFFLTGSLSLLFFAITPNSVYADMFPTPSRLNDIFSFSFLVLFTNALIITLLLETMFAFYFLRQKIVMRLIAAIILANCISLPTFWFLIIIFWSVFPTNLIWLIIILILGEAFVIAFEARFIYSRLRMLLSLKQSYILSILMNLTSMTVGSILGMFVWFKIVAPIAAFF